MTLRTLVVRHLFSHPVRSLLTIGAVVVAAFLFCFLRSVVTTLDAAVKDSAKNRLITASAVSLFQALPETYLETIAAVPGVESVSRFTWFGGLYRDESGFFAQFATDPETLLQQYPEVIIPEEQSRAWFEDRRGVIIGAGLADKYGWKPGDDVPLLGTIYPKVDGSAWTFTVRGVYRSTSANVDELTMYFHHELLDEVRERGESYGPSGVSVFLIRMLPDARAGDVIAGIDDRYASGPQRTLTQTEAAFQAGFLTMLGNVPTFLGMIGGAVLIALLFGVVNTMTLAARERTKTTGVLKSLGFPNRVPARLYLYESAALVGIGCAVGILLAVGIQDGVRQALGSRIPMYTVRPETMVFAVLVCLVIALLAGAVPAWRALRLRPTDALRETA